MDTEKRRSGLPSDITITVKIMKDQEWQLQCQGVTEGWKMFASFLSRGETGNLSFSFFLVIYHLIAFIIIQGHQSLSMPDSMKSGSLSGEGGGEEKWQRIWLVNAIFFLPSS